MMLGIEAVAEGAYAAGVRLFTSAPDTASAEAVAYLQQREDADELRMELAPNEKVALEVAYGASLSGARALCVVSSSGLNAAADPFFAGSAIGVRGGLVIVAVDDPGGCASRWSQDSRPIALSACVPVLEPSYSHEIFVAVVVAYELSERFDTPVLVRLTRRLAFSRSSTVGYGERKQKNRWTYLEKPEKFALREGRAARQHDIQAERMRQLAEYADEAALNDAQMHSAELGVVSSGVCFEYAQEAFPGASFLKLGITHPLPAATVLEFASQVNEVLVVEEMEPFIENQMRELGVPCRGKDLLPRHGEFSADLLRRAALDGEEGGTVPANDLPERPPVMCAGCGHRGILHVLRSLRARVIGDLGCLTLGSFEPLGGMDAVLCLGGAVGVAHGLDHGNPDSAGRTVAVTGDGALLHSGIPALQHMISHNSPGTVIVAENEAVGFTGGQPHSASGWNLAGGSSKRTDLAALIRALGAESVQVVDPTDLGGLRRVVEDAMRSNGLDVIVARRPCEHLRLGEAPLPFTVTANCRDCGACHSLGCPAIGRSGGRAEISAKACVGCSMCAQVCPHDAIDRREAR